MKIGPLQSWTEQTKKVLCGLAPVWGLATETHGGRIHIMDKVAVFLVGNIADSIIQS